MAGWKARENLLITSKAQQNDRSYRGQWEMGRQHGVGVFLDAKGRLGWLLRQLTWREGIGS